MKLGWILFLPLFTSCSVIMASKKAGFDLESIQAAHSRHELLDLGGDPISSHANEEGEVTEVYQILKEKGSTARALMHGLLDLGTGFLWELAGTPIESALSQEKFYSVKVTFDSDDQVKRMELQ